MELEMNDTEIADSLEIAMACDALFEQYDDAQIAGLADYDCCENLYPNVA